MYCGCARTSLDMDRILDFSLGGHNILRNVTTGETGAASVTPKLSPFLLKELTLLFRGANVLLLCKDVFGYGRNTRF